MSPGSSPARTHADFDQISRSTCIRDRPVEMPFFSSPSSSVLSAGRRSGVLARNRYKVVPAGDET